MNKGLTVMAILGVISGAVGLVIGAIDRNWSAAGWAASTSIWALISLLDQVHNSTRIFHPTPPDRKPAGPPPRPVRPPRWWGPWS